MWIRVVSLACCLNLLAACGSGSGKHGAATSTTAASDTAGVLAAMAAAARGHWRVTYRACTGICLETTIATDGSGRASRRSETSEALIANGFSTECNTSFGKAPSCTRVARTSKEARELTQRVLGIAVEFNGFVAASVATADSVTRKTVAARPSECFTFRGRNVLQMLAPEDRASFAKLDLRNASTSACFDRELGILLSWRPIFAKTDADIATTVGEPSDSDFEIATAPTS